MVGADPSRHASCQPQQSALFRRCDPTLLYAPHFGERLCMPHLEQRGRVHLLTKLSRSLRTGACKKTAHSSCLLGQASEATLTWTVFGGNALVIKCGSTQHQPASLSSPNRYSRKSSVTKRFA